MALTSSGQVLMLGSNQYAQHCLEDLQKHVIVNRDKKKPQFIAFHSFNIVDFHFSGHEVIEQIACGAEHLFAKT